MYMAARIFIVGLILTAASWQLRAGEEKKEPKDQKDQLTDFSYLYRYWGLKLKTISLLPARKEAGGEYADFAMLFEFERDLTFNEVSELREALLPQIKKIQFVFQDQDNIIFKESRSFIVEGLITGIKGDAIRLLTQDVRTQTVARAKKMIARQYEP